MKSIRKNIVLHKRREVWNCGGEVYQQRISDYCLKIEKWALMPTYLGRRIARLRIGKIPPEIEEGWLAAAVLLEIKESVEKLQAMRTQQLNWSGYVFRIVSTHHRKRRKRITRRNKAKRSIRGETTDLLRMRSGKRTS